MGVRGVLYCMALRGLSPTYRDKCGKPIDYTGYIMVLLVLIVKQENTE